MALLVRLALQDLWGLPVLWGPQALAELLEPLAQSAPQVRWAPRDQRGLPEPSAPAANLERPDLLELFRLTVN